MKKLMITVAIVCAAVAANAATYSWDCTGTLYWDNENADANFKDATVYAFDGNLYNKANILEALGTTGTSALDDALGYGTVNEWDEYSFTDSTVITDDGKEVAYIKAFLVAVTKDEKFATAIDIADIKVTDGVSSDGASLGLDWGVATLPSATSADWTSVAPEPTSGLLLLIGVAGLALRRRRA